MFNNSHTRPNKRTIVVVGDMSVLQLGLDTNRSFTAVLHVSSAPSSAKAICLIISLLQTVGVRLYCKQL